MNKPYRAYPAPRFRIFFFAIALLPCTAGSAAAGSIYRCVDAAGHTEFRQTGCESGSGRQLLVKTPKIGWLKPKPLSSAARPSGREEANEAVPQPETSAVSADQRRCWKVRQRLQRIQWELRKGYQRDRGERLRQQRREQQDFLAAFCR